MTTIVSFVVVIGILILIHELGHFFVARWTGVGVERFSIGFGPVLLRWRGKETEYCLSAIPMGGYVKMLGEENPLEGGAGAIPHDPRKAFALKPLWARFLIVFAGPGMNLVLAAAIFAAVLGTLGRPVWPAVVGKVTPDSPAARAGIETGDRIVAVDGRSVAYWEDLERALKAAHGRPVSLRVESDAGARTVTLTPRRTTVTDPIFREPRETWDVGLGPRLVPQISSVQPGSPAERAGLAPGDVVVGVEGQRVYTPEDMVEVIRARPGESLSITVERDGARRTVTVVPEAEKEKGLDGEEREVGRIQAGIATKAVRFEPYDPLAALWHGAVRTWDVTLLTLKVLWKVATLQLDSSNIGGPVQIATEAGRQARDGVAALALFTAYISVNLAVLNLLPVPMLDGGHLFFFVCEALLGRPVSLRTREVAQQVGFVLLMLLMGYALYNDLARLDAFRFIR
ncbi:MAG TPA: RIP metalloprotease RseP [Candidatus Tectomicrobia bacterium]|nr:RIP metalloprotease RseP [Candidatus Tectomicrobia bacterium]